ncbi:XPG domain containing-domain-containing protein [Blyttiomyces helicus]|uniref:XPG domain containing-domain-containing protein n=1 Tax=Blyttiomyces helicus TaxID=388810 RepID=A0A4P9W697_9FUNG|nr:XPG domain containing-domain-containing protein [Blyttiomyces helicus]|eukprot:RKO85636.1 XPG domain containing-domain-containing protein [Blyttiomyces helicus]
MGVPGLASFVAQGSIGIPLALPPRREGEGAGPAGGDASGDTSQVIVDGNSFVHQLSRGLGTPWFNGGKDRLQTRMVGRFKGCEQSDGVAERHSALFHTPFPSSFPAPHKLLASALISRVEAFLASGLNPVFVFDGPCRPTKFPERTFRDIEKITQSATVVAALVAARHGNGEALAPAVAGLAAAMLSPLVIHGCMHALRARGVEVVVPESEADGAVAALARAYACPVLSLDSDFFIHPLADDDAAVIPRYLPLDSLELPTAPGQPLRALGYARVDVAAMLGIAPASLPALAALVGCDYVSRSDQKIMRKLFSVDSGGRHGLIMAVARALKGYPDTDDPLVLVDRVLSRAPTADRQRLCEALHLAIKQYDITPCPQPLPVPSPAGAFSVTMLIRSGHYSAALSDILEERTFWCRPILEDVTRVSAWDASRPIRQTVYALVNSSSSVVEYIRRGDRLASEIVDPRPSENVPYSSQDAETVYLRTLKSDTARIRALPRDLIPLAASVRFLVQELGPRSPIANYELMGLLVSGVASCDSLVVSSSTSSATSSASAPPSQPTPPSPTPIRPSATRSSIHLLAQLEATLFSALLLAHALFLSTPSTDADPFISAHWCCLDGPDLHRCIQLAKGGAPADRLVGDAPHVVGVFQTVWDAVSEDILEDVELVIAYAVEGRGTGAPAKSKGRKKAGKVKKGASPKSGKRAVTPLAFVPAISSSPFEMLQRDDSMDG